MITSTAWVPRGFAAPFPTKYNFDEEEFERIANLAKLQLDDAQEDLEEAQQAEAEANAAVEESGAEEESKKEKKKKKKKAQEEEEGEAADEDGKEASELVSAAYGFLDPSPSGPK